MLRHIRSLMVALAVMMASAVPALAQRATLPVVTNSSGQPVQAGAVICVDEAGVYAACGGSGGGGGAVTIANGADVTQGAIADSAYAGSGSATVISALKAIANSALSSTPTTVNVTQVAGASVATGHGVASGALRVELPTDGTGVVGLAAGANVAGKFGIDQTTPGTTNAVQIVAGSTGGASSYHVIPGASDNHVVIKNGAGTLYSIDVTSIHSTYQYVRLYDAGTGFNGCNSATNLIWGAIVPGSTTGAGIVKPWNDSGKAFASGLSICVTGAFSDTDTTNATASVMSVNVGYK